ncbi:MAG TPA: hypothetical protein VMC08_00275, partial [Bacteroidales bacterium]|nr:hypothetical protein [Bacteroidales bacterium]
MHSPASGIQHPAPSIRYHRIDFDFIGFNPEYTVEAGSPSSDYLNYYTTGTPPEGVTFVRSFGNVIYRNIYPGIDLEFSTDARSRFKYTLVIHPEGDIRNICFQISDPQIEMLPSGSLELTTATGGIREEIPNSFFRSQDLESKVGCRFIQKGPGLFGMEVDGTIPPGATLVIDPLPVREWATYYGGSLDDRGGYVKVDSLGYIYMTGYSSSYNNIATSGAHQDTLGGSMDGFMVKFAPSGERIWGTYYGGSVDEFMGRPAFDHWGNIYISGWTDSPDNISTPGSHQPALGGNLDGFLVKFSHEGVRIWGTYYGGTGTDMGGDVVTDLQGDVYLSGSTTSLSNISTPGAFKVNESGGNDGFLVKFDSSGTRVWGTYYGGSGEDDGGVLATDYNGHLVMGGETFSDNGISTLGCFQYTRGGLKDGYLAEFDTAGNRIWGTYFGGSDLDGVLEIKMTPTGIIYFVGSTKSMTNIATAGSHQWMLGGGQDGFLEKFNLDGSRIWGTYYGGTNYDQTQDLFIGDSLNVFITGYTDSGNNISSPDGFQPVFGGYDNDAFLAKFNPAGQRIWGTYYGDTQYQIGISVGEDTCGHIYMAGETNSPDSIATSGSFQPYFGGGVMDCFLVKFDNCRLPEEPLPISGPASVCQGTSGVIYSVPPVAYATGYSWLVPPGATITGGLNTPSITVDFGSSATSGNIVVFGINCCGNSDPAFLMVTVNPAGLPPAIT